MPYDHCMQYLITNFSEFQLASAGTFIIHESVFFLSGLPYLLMETWGLRKYKIQVTNAVSFVPSLVPFSAPRKLVGDDVTYRLL